jgi:hypothetical protein
MRFIPQKGRCMFYTISNWVFVGTVLFVAIGIFNDRRGRFETGTRWGTIFKYFPVILLPTILTSELPDTIKGAWYIILIPLLLGCGIGLYLHDVTPALYGLGWCLPLACAITALDLSGRW